MLQYLSFGNTIDRHSPTPCESMSQCAKDMACHGTSRQRRKGLLVLRFLIGVLFCVIVTFKLSARKKNPLIMNNNAVDILEQTIRSANYKSYSRFNARVTHFLHKVDHIFLMTTSMCEFENLPHQWSNSSSCVNVRDFDTSLYGNQIDRYDHHAKITTLHLAFLQLAKQRKYRNFAVIEADSFCVTNGQIDDAEIEIFENFLTFGSWSLIRFGYRPFFLEGEKAENDKCPKTCICTCYPNRRNSLGSFGCVISSTKCDIRSSDMYILNSIAYDEFEAQLHVKTVDVEPMQSLQNTWFIVPQASFQFDSAQFLETQLYYADKFKRDCVRASPSA